MSRFNTVQEVRDYALRVARKDIIRHQENGIDLNPFCTPGARNYWQRGFDNAPAYSWEHDLNWDTQYQRGRACAELLAEVAA
jgi:hypothetical protein